MNSGALVDAASFTSTTLGVLSWRLESRDYNNYRMVHKKNKKEKRGYQGASDNMQPPAVENAQYFFLRLSLCDEEAKNEEEDGEK
ncbi:hypothetical protein L5515_011257 [Caenorhabditis briggsae]|uniref:Uncharacterized protein n=1 Tax=Caenorhabditis briggsae TaxID=6238 RepID=A0AAE9JF85_CAEBR|nr:hypothetical protein L5515_011257 [Caenorhabditis briggsae]